MELNPVNKIKSKSNKNLKRRAFSRGRLYVKADIAELRDNKAKDALGATQKKEGMVKKPEGGRGKERAEVGH